MRSEKGNQKGFTLLELLVAIAVLAIIAIPLLNAFLVSVRTDAKAKDQQRATTVATNVIEDMKCQSWANLTQGFHQDQGIYSATKKKEMDGKDFTVEITLDPSQDTEVSVNALDEVTDYNQERLARLYSIDETCDGIYVQRRKQNEEIAKTLKGIDSVDATLYTGIKRDIRLSIVKNDTTTKVSVDNTFFYNQLASQSTEQETIYLNRSGDQTLRNIYLFYYPMYNNKLSNVTETITLDNADGIPVNVYVVCLGYDEETSPSYQLQLRCLEPERQDAGEKVITRVCSNLPLAKNWRQKGLWLTYLSGDHQSTFYDSQWANASSYGGIQACDILDYHDLSNAEQDDWVYQATVKVYEGWGEKKGNELITLTSTIEKK